MNAQINQLVKSLLQKDTLEQCSLQELEQFASRHPYFGAAQLLLTKKLQLENSERFDEQLQKTFLYFHNPLWVEHLLNETGNAEMILPATTPRQELPEGNAIISPVTIEDKGETIEPLSTATSPISIVGDPESEPVKHLEFPASKPKTAPAEETAIISPVTVEDKGETVELLPTAHSPISIMEDPETEPVQPPKVTASNSEPELSIPAPETPFEIPALKIEAIHQDLEDPAKAELLFEPYHTVDYFASQGIKFKEEELPRDKFGQQLKSFTDWLKTMKRLPVAEISKMAGPVPEIAAVAEQKVEQLAAHSLEAGEVVTEAMAEVWEKQGNAAKASEIYRKLSLLDPSKSHYFAAKIEELKKIN
jgi:hypothetical protein